MLSPTERELVQRDASLPGLEKLLDAEAFRDALQAAADVPIHSARLRYLRYKPTQNCVAAYLLNIRGTEVECHAKAYCTQDAGKLEKAAARPDQVGPLGRGRFVWPHAGIEVCVFPNDNKLPALPLLAAAESREDFLRRHLPERSELWRSTIRKLAYKPERRWVGALETEGVPLAVCKLYGESSFEAVRARAKQFVARGPLNFPPLIGRSKGRRALFFGWVTGEVLSQAMLKPRFEAATLRPVGAALQELHQLPNTHLPERSHDDLVRAARGIDEFISFLLPVTASRVQNIFTELASAMSSEPTGHTTIHGDFYAKQILLNDGGITVLDLDEAARGNGLMDLGSFAAHLEREVIAGRMTPEGCGKLRSELLAGYCERGATVDERRLNLYTAERLFARAADFFRTHEPDWPLLTDALITRVEVLLSAARGGAPSRRSLDAKLPALEAALSPSAIEPRLVRLMSQRDRLVTEVNLSNVKLRRHKPGRRALIEYQLDLQRDGYAETLVLLGKLKRRGVDAENLALCRELSADRFHPDSPDGIAIPQVIGAVIELGMVFQQRVAGRPVAELLTACDGVRAARRSAEAISKLHQSELSPHKVHTIADELEILDERLSSLAEIKPDWSRRLDKVLRTCHDLARQLPIVTPRPIHRDFYHDQLLLDGDRVWLLDLDLLCAGDPALDAGNFVGHLLERGIRCPAEAEALEEVGHAFADRFLELHPSCSREALEIYITLTLVRHISISTQFAERAPFTEAILARCEARCRQAHQTESISQFS